MSNKKNLLKENTVRRFMKLAGTQTIGTGFLQENYMELAEAPEDELEDEFAGAEELPGEPEGVELEVEDELEGELEEEPEGEGSIESFARDALDAIASVAEKHGVDIEVEEGEEPEEVEVGELEVEEDDLGGELGPGDEEMEVEEEDDDEAVLDALQEITYIDEDTLMEKVYKRVTSRLLKEKRADDVAERLAQRLANRVSKKLR
jgi:hypothetical protein